MEFKIVSISMRHVKKCWSVYFQKVLDGKKRFELRLADWKCEPGDELVLQEWDPETKEYSGREIVKKVDYVLNTKNLEMWPKEDVEKFGYQIITWE